MLPGSSGNLKEQPCYHMAAQNLMRPNQILARPKRLNKNEGARAARANAQRNCQGPGCRLPGRRLVQLLSLHRCFLQILVCEDRNLDPPVLLTAGGGGV